MANAATRLTRTPKGLIIVSDPTRDGIAKIDGLLAHARLSHSYWLRVARETRLGLSDNRYGGAYAIDGAATWRRRAGELLAQRRALAPRGARR